MERGVRQYEQHPVGQEFGRVLAEISMGKGRIGAFEALRDRLNDDEITSIVGSILQGEQLGTPLARLFRTQADVLRLKRSQRAETMAGEAGVKMLLPGVMVMASTVIIILGPFILGFLYSDVI
jgi:tight adherence protein C